MFEVDEELDELGQPDFVAVWESGTLEELQEIIDHYKKLGFNKVWHGHDNSTLCIQKVKEK